MHAEIDLYKGIDMLNDPLCARNLILRNLVLIIIRPSIAFIKILSVCTSESYFNFLFSNFIAKMAIFNPYSSFNLYGSLKIHE